MTVENLTLQQEARLHASMTIATMLLADYNVDRSNFDRLRALLDAPLIKKLIADAMNGEAQRDLPSEEYLNVLNEMVGRLLTTAEDITTVWEMSNNFNEGE